MEESTIPSPSAPETDVPAGESSPPETAIPAGDRTLKYSCYLVFLLMFFFSVSGPSISSLGLFLLWLAAPFGAARRLKVRATGKHIVWLFLAIGATAGIISGSRYFPPLLCISLSAVFWGLYLSYGVLLPKPVSFRLASHTALSAFFSDPWAFFAPVSDDDRDVRGKRLDRGIYIGFLLLALLIVALLLVAQADVRIGRFLRDLWELLSRQAPVIVSCLILALFPTAFVYGFLTALTRPENDWTESSELNPAVGHSAILPWFAPCLLLTVINCAFLLAELYYTSFSKDNPLPSDYNFYDIFSILFLVSVSLTVLLCRPNPVSRRDRALSICLSVADAGLLFVAGFRLVHYICFHGLWDDRLLLCVFFLLLCFLSLCIFWLSFQHRPHQAARKIGIAVAVVVIVLLIIPKGLLLTEINVSCFIYKYNNQQLDVQRAGSTDALILLSADDLDLDAIRSYGVDGVPALTKLVKIDDIIYKDQVLGDIAQEVILDILCSDIGLTSTGNLADDLNNISDAASRIPRYRLPTNWSIAIRSLEEIESDFKKLSSTSEE